MLNKAKILGSALASGLLAMSSDKEIRVTDPLVAPRMGDSGFEMLGFKSKRKNNFPQGKRCRARDAKKYIPAGAKRNVDLPTVKNHLQAEDMDARHNAWHEANKHRFDQPTRRQKSLEENAEKEAAMWWYDEASEIPETAFAQN